MRLDKKEVSTVHNYYELGGKVLLSLRRGNRPDMESCGLFFEREDWARDASQGLQEWAFGQPVTSRYYLR